MRVRIGHGPNDWKDEGPGAVISTVIRGSLVVPVGRPVVDRREAARKAAITRRRLVQLCGAPMKRTTELCARKAGHGNFHSAAATLARTAERRRAA